MSNLMASVNQRTNLVGQNRLELLLFRLHGEQRFGINVFKVREVIQCPELTEMPGSHPCVRGIAHLRGVPVMVIDMSQATGGKPLQDLKSAYILVTEYNRNTQGFLVGGVDRIVNLNWEQIQSPPQGSGKSHYLTAVTEIDKELVEIIDVEKILEEISPSPTTITAAVETESIMADLGDRTILIADDSAVARNQVKRALEGLGVTMHLVKNGREALTYLQEVAAQCDQSVTEKIGLMISDIEMPDMDGYTLTAEVRLDPKLKPLHVILHTSLSGVFNQQMVQKVGADDFIAKFNPDELGDSVRKWLHAD